MGELGSCTYLLPFYLFLFLMVLSFSQFVVIAGLQRAELRRYGYSSLLCIFEVSHRVVYVNLLINMISVCKKYLMCWCTSF